MLPRKEILSLLSSMGIDLPRKTKLTDAELDKRLSKALDSAQYLARVIPAPPLDPTAYPSWFHNKSNRPILDAIRRHNLAEATLVDESRKRGIENPIPLYTNAFMDLRQSLMTIGDACDNGMKPLILQDAEHTSGICMRVLDVLEFDDQTPIIIVVFQHNVEGSLSQGSFDWISSYAFAPGPCPLRNITATVKEQHLLLRILNHNKKRVVSSYNPNRAPAEASFTLSFLLPIGPLGAQEMAKYNANNGCSVCGEPAKRKCSRCGAVRYCDEACQKEDWKSHRALCNSWQGAKWQSLTFVAYPNGMFAFRYNKYDNVQHEDTHKRWKEIEENLDDGPPSNTHGTTPFIVKLQVSSSMAQSPGHTRVPEKSLHDGTSFLIYDQRRTIDVTVLREFSDAASFDGVKEVMRGKGPGGRGLKAFFWAIRTGEWTLDVCLDRFPEWQSW
ncbi:hypothetical protein DFH08DRAFT_1089806 [Mycena albidolilacea]|uniref:MYND-type domain-containing protein n=1 Tax=Mycena albidolilacea TaxID=1033008 RepID=A0AAD7E812_9AGAR|nr:hypothetical protein DFH08DRAFT_1089806 [Mycena albidolilacea]